jgi:hypothetical protein
MPLTVGSILHGAYGDYYEQMVSLRLYKRRYPDRRIILFFASESRRKEMAVFDTSFADEIHPAAALTEVHVDTFLQFQVQDQELRVEVLDKLPPDVLAKIDLNTVHKPWTWIRRAWLEDPTLCDIPMSAAAAAALPACMLASGINNSLFQNRVTVGFLWRYRAGNGAISPGGQPPEETVRATKGALLQHFLDRYDATVLVAGMNLTVDDSNRERTDCKFSDRTLPVCGDCRYLKGLGWGLELEIMRRCSLCFVMASGFSEALWLKRRGRTTVLVDPPRQYLLKLVYNRMPFFSVLTPRNWTYYWLKPHTPETVLRVVNREADVKLRSLLAVRRAPS